MQYSLTFQNKATADSLICPVCGERLSFNGDRSLVCAGGKHLFDISSKGHVNLALGHAGGGDPKEAVRSRSDFLRKDYYLPFASAVCETVLKYLPDQSETVVDAGCGEGYYTEMIAEKCGVGVIGFDLSKAAIESAALRALRQGRTDLLYAVAGIYSMPVADGCADAVVNLFAPCAEEEFQRVLKKGGILLVASAGEDHLFGLKKRLYKTPYKNERRNDLPTSMDQIYHSTVRFELTVESEEDKHALFSMTPYYYRTSREDAEKLSGDPLITEAEFDIDVYVK